MKLSRFSCVAFLLVSLAAPRAAEVAPDSNESIRLFSEALAQLVRVVVPPTNEAPRTFTTTLKLTKGAGLSKQLLDRQLEIAIQAPDHLRLAAEWDGSAYVAGRDGEQLWIHVPAERFGLISSPGVPRFSSDPGSIDSTPLGPFKLPVPPEQILVLPFLVDLQLLPNERVGATECRVIKATPTPEAIQGFHLPKATLQVWIREKGLMPLKIAYWDPPQADVEIELGDSRFSAPWPEAKWKLRPSPGEHIQTVARSHLSRFLAVAYRQLNEKIPVLGPATGERRVLAREGKGRLELQDGTRVLFLEGSPEEMGRQQGTLLKKQVRDLVDHTLYGIGVGGSVLKGQWVFGEIENAEKRLKPFIDDRYFREMDALADAAGLAHQEVRLANFFPELFHCSGFAIFGKATEGGRCTPG